MTTINGNGKLLNNSRMSASGTYEVVPIPSRLIYVMYGQIGILGLLMASVLFEACVVVPGLKEAAATIKGERESELTRLKMLDDARTKQVVQEATILMHQQEIDRLQKAMIKRAN